MLHVYCMCTVYTFDVCTARFDEAFEQLPLMGMCTACVLHAYCMCMCYMYCMLLLVYCMCTACALHAYCMCTARFGEGFDQLPLTGMVAPSVSRVWYMGGAELDEVSGEL